MLTKTNQLNEKQLLALHELIAICKKVDGSVPNLYLHLLTQARALPTIGLYYKKERLIGFISVYFFYEDAVEVALLVHPDARRKGLAQELVRNIIPLVREHNYSKLIFSSPAHVNDHWMPALHFAYSHSEYYMERRDLNPLLDPKKTLAFRSATTDDIPLLCALDEACFHKGMHELKTRFQHILSERKYQIILAFENNQFVGKAHLRWEEHGATLSDIAVFPDKQGRGLGTTLITHCINYALSEGKPDLNLDVETHNKKALDLYIRLGFVTQNACDYWAIEIDTLHKLFNQSQTTKS